MCLPCSVCTLGSTAWVDWVQRRHWAAAADGPTGEWEWHRPAPSHLLLCQLTISACAQRWSYYPIHPPSFWLSPSYLLGGLVFTQLTAEVSTQRGRTGTGTATFAVHAGMSTPCSMPPPPRHTYTRSRLPAEAQAASSLTQQQHHPVPLTQPPDPAARRHLSSSTGSLASLDLLLDNGDHITSPPPCLPGHRGALGGGGLVVDCW